MISVTQFEKLRIRHNNLLSKIRNFQFLEKESCTIKPD